MAKLLKDGSIILSDGTLLYGDLPLSTEVALEVIPLFVPAPIWPFIGGGGGIAGNPGEDGPQGNKGPNGSVGAQGAQGSQGFQGPQGSSGFQGSQGNQGNIGDTSVSVFNFTHEVGSASTGALGFTPRYIFYSGIVVAFDAVGVSHVFGFANETDQMGAGWGIGASVVSVDLGGAGGDVAIFGNVTIDKAIPFTSSFFNALRVSAFSSAGITLTWDSDVFEHSGKLIVVGTP